MDLSTWSIECDPELYLAQLENIFEVKGITSQKEKFANAVSSLPKNIARNVRDIIINPPATNPFEVLKGEIVSRTSVTEQKKISQLLSEEKLGDRKPSEFLRKLREIAGNYDDDVVIRRMFLSQLPVAWQSVLLAVGDGQSLEKLADAADNMANIAAREVPVAPAKTGESELAELIKQNAKILEKLDTLIGMVKVGFAPLYPHKARSRSRSSGKDKHSVCYLHRKFGNEARSCYPPCDYNDPESF